MSGHKYPRATKQIHFTTIINTTPEKSEALIDDTHDITNGLHLQARIINETSCDISK